jgi:serine/threonine protein kinase
MPDIIGQVIDNRYKVIRLLGRGGMAAVYLAEDSRLERNVALKIILPESFSGDDWDNYSERFKKEIKTLAKFNHPNIVSIYDSGEWDGKPFFIMEYLAGGTLEDKLNSPLDSKEAAKILLPIARALAYAHDKKTIHRDVKPKNILITEDGTYKLADFGIMRVSNETGLTTQTHVGLGIGTPAYMAPEQVLNQGITKQVDIYSLGITFFRMVTGKLPFEGDPFVVMMKHVNEELPSPSKFIPELSELATTFIIKTTAKRPNERYKHMDDVSCCLEDILYDPKPIVKQLSSTSPRPATLNLSIGLPNQTPTLIDAQIYHEIALDEITLIDGIEEEFTLTSLSENGSMIAACYGSQTLSIWSTIDGSLVLKIDPRLDSRISSLTFSKDNKYVFLGYIDGDVVQFDIQKSILIRKWKAHKSFVRSLAVSSDNCFIGTGSENKAILLWDIGNGKLIHEFWHDRSVRNIAYSIDRKYLASGRGASTYVYSMETGKLINYLPSRSDWVISVKFSPNCCYLAEITKQTELCIFTIPKGKLIYSSFLVKNFDSLKKSMILFAPDGKELAIGLSESHKLIIVSNTGKVKATYEFAFPILDIAYINDGKNIVVSLINRTLQFINTNN